MRKGKVESRKAFHKRLLLIENCFAIFKKEHFNIYHHVIDADDFNELCYMHNTIKKLCQKYKVTEEKEHAEKA